MTSGPLNRRISQAVGEHRPDALWLGGDPGDWESSESAHRDIMQTYVRKAADTGPGTLYDTASLVILGLIEELMERVDLDDDPR